MVFKVEEITSPKVHRKKVHDNVGKWQNYTVSYGRVEEVEG